MIDLHTHSSESDGSLAPRELVGKAGELGLTAIALTDHDTIGGLDEAEAAAREAGIRLIPGIEIEVEYTGGEFHLLGLGIDGWRGEFSGTLKALQDDRHTRNQAMLGKMHEAGIDVEYREIEELAGGDIVGRPHFARALVNKGLAKDSDDAFQRFLKPGMPYYVKKRALTVKEAADLVHLAGGKAVIAHPLSLHLGWKILPERLAAYKELGIDGIEAFHSNATYRECKRLEAVAGELGILVTAGSDFHGDHIPFRKLGRTCEGRWIEERFALPFLR